MEKIKTPLIAHVQFIDSAISGLEKLQLSHKKDSRRYIEIRDNIYSLEAIKRNAESLLQTERDMIEKAHLDGQKRSHSPSKEVSEIYFKNTFESYE